MKFTMYITKIDVPTQLPLEGGEVTQKQKLAVSFKPSLPLHDPRLKEVHEAIEKVRKEHFSNLPRIRLRKNGDGKIFNLRSSIVYVRHSDREKFEAIFSNCVVVKATLTGEVDSFHLDTLKIETWKDGRIFDPSKTFPPSNPPSPPTPAPAWDEIVKAAPKKRNNLGRRIHSFVESVFHAFGFHHRKHHA